MHNVERVIESIAFHMKQEDSNLTPLNFRKSLISYIRKYAKTRFSAFSRKNLMQSSLLYIE